jgi:hypothetical protein
MMNDITDKFEELKTTGSIGFCDFSKDLQRLIVSMVDKDFLFSLMLTNKNMYNTVHEIYTIPIKTSYIKMLYSSSLMEWARANGCPWNELTCAYAAEGGHLEIIQWARANGCPWEEWTCACAAEGGHLEILQWARANGCPWDKKTCEYAAKGGHLGILQWANANGCHWDADTCACAAEGGHL